jgi:predicted acetyltransferase
VTLRELTVDDWPQLRALSGLAFGYAPPEQQPREIPAIRLGVFDGDRLTAVALGRPYEQWWCGRIVPMCGIVGVAVHPDARGRGLVRGLMDAVLDRTSAPVSVLFPTAPAIYRGMGWEVVGTLDETTVPLSHLPRSSPTGVTTRGARPEDLPRLHELYVHRGRSGSGLLTREGTSFPDGLLGVDVVTVAEEGGRITGWMSYDRGQGYQHGGPLRVRDCVTATADAMTALLAGLASWSAVVDEVRWRGLTTDLVLAVGRSLPVATTAQPWMLRVLDVPAALQSRGWRHAGAASFAVEDRGWSLEVQDGQAQVTPVPPDGLPRLHPRGLALLYAGADTSLLLRSGLLDRQAPELSVFGGPAPEILDYF